MDTQRLKQLLMPTWYSLGGTLLLSVFATTAWVLRNLYALGGGRAYPLLGDIMWTVAYPLLLWPFAVLNKALNASGAVSVPSTPLLIVAMALTIAYFYLLSSAIQTVAQRIRSA